jgi:hypothetical protein
MPQRIPLPESERVVIAFALLTKAVDREIFETIAEIHKLESDFKENKT